MVLSSAKSFTKRSTTTTNTNGSTEGWGTGFLLVLFPEDDESNSNSPSSLRHHHHSPHSTTTKTTTTTTTAFLPLCSPLTPGSRRRLIHKTQSTLSICGLLVFTTFLLFTLSTFEPAAAIRSRSSTSFTSSTAAPSRRILLRSTPSPSLTSRLSNYLLFRPTQDPRLHSAAIPPAALQGMGTLHRRGTRAMSDLLVAHVSDQVNDHELRSFLRILHNTGVMSRSDLVFLFPSSSSSFTSRFFTLITDENDSFLQLLSATNETTRTPSSSSRTQPDFPPGLARYYLTKTKEAKEPIWGKKKGNGAATPTPTPTTTTNSSSTPPDEQPITTTTGPSYGSIVSFDASELDPENSLSGFMDRAPPISLRRWACYPMLLGRVRRKYKHMALTDVKEIVILNDPFTKIRNRTPESVMLWTTTTPEKGRQQQQHGGGGGGGKKGSSSSHHSHGGGHNSNNNNDHSTSVTNIVPGIVVGGNRGVRKLSEAVLTEIVRTAIAASATKGKKKGGKSWAVTESGIVNQLVRGGRVLKNVDLVVNENEPIVEAVEVAIGARTGRVWSGGGGGAVARWGNSGGGYNDKGNLGSSSTSSGIISGVIVRGVCCLSELQRVVYRDCLVSDSIMEG